MGLIEDFIAEHPKEMELAQMRRREVKKLLADYDKTLREQIAREIMENFDGGHIKGENGCSCQEDSDPCYFCGAKDYTMVAAAIARGSEG